VCADLQRQLRGENYREFQKRCFEQIFGLLAEAAAIFASQNGRTIQQCGLFIK
jgi:hypothetical protein